MGNNISYDSQALNRVTEEASMAIESTTSEMMRSQQETANYFDQSSGTGLSGNLANVVQSSYDEATQKVFADLKSKLEGLNQAYTKTGKNNENIIDEVTSYYGG